MTRERRGVEAFGEEFSGESATNRIDTKLQVSLRCLLPLSQKQRISTKFGTRDVDDWREDREEGRNYRLLG